jgi:hypothetical protein
MLRGEKQAFRCKREEHLLNECGRKRQRAEEQTTSSMPLFIGRFPASAPLQY